MIDFHTHIFPDKIAESTLSLLKDKCKTTPYTNGMIDGLVSSTVDAGIDLSVVLPVVTKPTQFSTVNHFAASIENEHLLSFGGIHPDSSNYKEELNTIKSLGLKGIKLHPDYQGVYIDDIRYERIISYATEIGLIVVTHAGFDPGYPDCTHCTPLKVSKMISEVQPDKLVLAHLGGFMRWDEVEEYLVGKNIYFDTAVVLDLISKEQFIRIARNHGIDKILFASDSPWADQKKFVNILNAMPMTRDEKEQIFDKNARKLLTL